MRDYLIFVINKSGKFLECWGGGQINLTFRRNFDTPKLVEWGDLENELTGIELTSEENSVRWALTSHG
jgi:hypothetical protein